MEKIQKTIVVFDAVLIGLGFYSLANWFSNGITPAKVMSLVGLGIVATFVERRYSRNTGIWFFLEIGRDVLGGLGSLSILHLLPITIISEELSVVVMLATTAILGITVPDVFDDEVEDEAEDEEQ